MFLDEIKCPGFYISSSSMLSLYGSGKLHGVVMDSGYGLSTSIVNQEGMNNEY